MKILFWVFGVIGLLFQMFGVYFCLFLLYKLYGNWWLWVGIAVVITCMDWWKGIYFKKQGRKFGLMEWRTPDQKDKELEKQFTDPTEDFCDDDD